MLPAAQCVQQGAHSLPAVAAMRAAVKAYGQQRAHAGCACAAAQQQCQGAEALLRRGSVLTCRRRPLALVER